jgi:hypothetical protein
MKTVVDRGDADGQRDEADEGEERENELGAPPVDPSPLRRCDGLAVHAPESTDNSLSGL